MSDDIKPTNNPFEDWTFQELCDWATWQIVQGMLDGKMKSTISSVIYSAVGWSELQEKKKSGRRK